MSDSAAATGKMSPLKLLGGQLVAVDENQTARVERHKAGHIVSMEMMTGMTSMNPRRAFSGTERHSVCPGVDSVKGRGLGLLNCTLRERDRVQGVVLGVVGVPRGGLRIMFVDLRVDV